MPSAELASAGLGVTLLPIDCFQDQVNSGRLKVIETDPPMTPVEFTATLSMDGNQPINEIVADLAQELSTFDKG